MKSDSSPDDEKTNPPTPTTGDDTDPPSPGNVDDADQLIRDFNAARVQSHYEQMFVAHVRAHGEPAACVDWHQPVTLDRWNGITIGQYDRWTLQVLPMLFNDRLVMSPDRWGYDWGWCYPKGGVAYRATLLWNPCTQAEPVGFKKRIASYGRRTLRETT
jgi:hypothetical protein